MNSNIDQDSQTPGLLPHLGLVRFAGPDAVAFLQGQLSNDTRRLSGAAPLLAACSTPQGRVVAVLRLVPHSSGVIGMLPGELVAPVIERLRKYVMRAKVQIEDLRGRFAVMGLYGGACGDLEMPDVVRRYVETDGVGIARLTGDATRCWAIGREADFTAHGAAGNAGRAVRVERDWRLADIRAGLPQIYGATTESFVAQMLNLDLIDGISFTKGCFTGQEIIARTQHLGRIKRRLFRLRLPAGEWSIGQAVRLTDGRAGRLTELAPVDGVHEALAVLPLETGPESGAPEAGAAAESPADAPVEATELPLPYGTAAPRAAPVG